ncbi:MAG: hypothetical protein ACR2G4_12770 [Pyrinomonadaceae bacterium]
MAQYTDPLSFVRIAAPCRADWERMRGNERMRFCEQCSLNVYNLSNMSRQEAEALIVGAQGRLCVRYYRRADGTILTGNCPVGLQALKRRASKFSRAAISTVLSFFAGIGVLASLEKAQSVMGAATEVSNDLIDPVPLENFDPTEAPASEEMGVRGTLAYEPTEVWVKGRFTGRVKMVPLREEQHATK